MTREEQARQQAASSLRIARTYRREFEEPYECAGRAYETQALQAARHLADALAGGERDQYRNAMECAKVAALASDLLRERYERILNDRIARRVAL